MLHPILAQTANCHPRLWIAFHLVHVSRIDPEDRAHEYVVRFLHIEVNGTIVR